MSTRHVFKLLVLFLVAIPNIECSNNKNIDIERTLTVLLSPHILQHTNYVIVIPNAGCGGCIDSAVKFVTSNIDRFDNIQVIFTGHIDKKLLKLRLGQAFLERENVSIDEEEIFMSQDINTSYPHVIKLKNGKVLQIREMNTEMKFKEALLRN
ncbi:MAG: hypothetical protein KF687_01060 [Cyclobacteriaceae bacterium]|nr:hypothetical protein [Cyclobacteriaceae bacterium]